MSPDQENQQRQEPPEHTSDDGALAELLRAARWPDPKPDQLQRFERRWSELWLARVRRRRAASVLCLVATVAGLLIAISLWMDFATAPLEPREIAPAIPQPEPQEPSARQVAQSPPRPAEPREAPAPDSDTKTSKPEVSPVQVKTVSRSRPAKAYEKLALHLLASRRAPAREQPDRELIEAAVERRVSETNADLDELAKPLLAARGPNELALIERAQRSRGARQVAAIDLLGRVGTRRSVPLLAALVALPETHSAAVRALARLADSETIACLAGAEADPNLRQDLFAALLSRGDACAVVAYLEFVRQRQTRASALAALDRVPDPPLGLLFQSLTSRQQAQRSAAAVVLGRIDRPEVSERLMRMVIRDVQRREALLALAASSGAEASQFVALARNHPALAGSAHAAQYTLRRFFPPDLEVN